MLAGISVTQSSKSHKVPRQEKMEQVSTLFAALEAARYGRRADNQDADRSELTVGSQHGENTATCKQTCGRYRCVERNGVAIRSMPTEDSRHRKSRGPAFGEEIAAIAVVKTHQACGDVDYLQLADGGFCPMRISARHCWKVDKYTECRVRAQPDLRSAVLGTRTAGTRVYGTLVDCPMGGYPWLQLAGGTGYMLTQSGPRSKNLVPHERDDSDFFERVGSLPSENHAKFLSGLQEGDLVDVDLGSVTNDEGAVVALGQDLYYCGRRLGREAIPGSDGMCGPSNGPQCRSCKRYQARGPLSGQRGASDLVACQSPNTRWVVGKVAKNHVDLAGLGQLEVTVPDCERQHVEAAAQEIIDACSSSLFRWDQQALSFCHELEKTVRPLGEHTTESDLQQIVAAAPESGSELEIRLHCRPVLSVSVAEEEEDIGKVRAQASEELRTLTERLVQIDALIEHQQLHEDVVPTSKPDALAIVTHSALGSQPGACSEVQKKICEAVRSFWAAVDGASPAPVEEARPVNLFESAKRKRFVSIAPTDDDSLYRLTFLVDEHYHSVHVRVVQADKAAKVAKMAYLPLKSSAAFCYEHTWLANCTEESFEEAWKSCPVLCAPPYGVCDYAPNGFFTRRCAGLQRGPQLRIYERLSAEQETDGDSLGGRELDFNRANFGPKINVMARLQLAEISTELDSLAELNLAGKVGVVNRGGLSFVRKALIAQNAGAVALIIVNNESGSLYIGIDDDAPGDEDKVKIPVVSVRMKERESLAVAAAAGHRAILNLKRCDGRLNPTDDDFTKQYTFGPPGEEYIMYQHNRFAKQAQDLQEEKIQIQDDIRVLHHQVSSLDGILEVQRRLQQGYLDKVRWIRGSVKAREKWVAGSSLLAVEPQEDLDEATPREAQELTSAVGHICTHVPGVVNDEGARMTSSRDDPRYFCGRWFDRFNPNGNGQCGPDDGQHQCASCKRYETLHGQADQLMNWSWRPVVDSDAYPLQHGGRIDTGGVCRPAGVAILTLSTPVAGPAPTSPVAWISADLKTTMAERIAACTSLAYSYPQQLVGHRILMLHRDATKFGRKRRSHGWASSSPDNEIYTAAVIRGYSVDLGMHIVRADKALKQETNDSDDDSDEDSDDTDGTVEDLMMVDLGKVGFLVEPSSIPIAEREAVAALGTHTHVCTVCFCARPPETFTDFCFGRYKVDGHQVNVGEPRHPRSICSSCVRSHVTHELEGGKLVVRCPCEGCGRALQTRELAKHTTKAAYEALVCRIRDAENTNDQASIAAVLREAVSAGVELRRCPKCKVLIEKNQGCSSMRCYRCDHEFSWHRGEEIPMLQPAPSVETSSPSRRTSVQSGATSEPNGTANQVSRGEGSQKAVERVPDGWAVKYSTTKQVGRPYYVRVSDGHRQWDPPRQYGKVDAIAVIVVVCFFSAVLWRYIDTDVITNTVYWVISWGWWLVAAPFAAWRSTIWYIDSALTGGLGFVMLIEWLKCFDRVFHQSPRDQGVGARVRYIVLRKDQTSQRQISWLCTAAFLPVAAKVAWLFPHHDDGTGGAIAAAAVNTQVVLVVFSAAALGLAIAGLVLAAKRFRGSRYAAYIACCRG